MPIHLYFYTPTFIVSYEFILGSYHSQPCIKSNWNISITNAREFLLPSQKLSRFSFFIQNVVIFSFTSIHSIFMFHINIFCLFLLMFHVVLKISPNPAHDLMFCKSIPANLLTHNQFSLSSLIFLPLCLMLRTVKILGRTFYTIFLFLS